MQLDICACVPYVVEVQTVIARQGWDLSWPVAGR